MVILSVARLIIHLLRRRELKINILGIKASPLSESGYKNLRKYSMARNHDVRLYIENAQRYQTDISHAKKRDSL
jgi:hypothetical protein